MFNLDTPLNQEVRYDHGDGCRDVGESPDTRGRLYVKRTNTGWEWHCKNCGQGGFKAASGIERARSKARSVREASGRPGNTEIEHVDRRSIHVGDRADVQGVLFLQKYDCTSLADHCKSNERGHLLLPIYNTLGGLIGWNGRTFLETGPKYITTYLEEEHVSGSWWHLDSCQSIVIVEDIISAWKCYEAGTSAVALLSSPAKLQTDVEQYIIKNFKKVHVWLDPDKNKVALEYVKRLSAISDLEVRLILTSEDPKCYTIEEIQSKLRGDK